VNTGSLITCIVNGHWKESKTKEATAPAARDMISAQNLLVLALVLLLALPPTPEQWWVQ
jgi:hypothetical protein